MKYVFKKKRYAWLAQAFDTAGSMLSRAFAWLPPKPRAPMHRVLLIRLDHIGDILHISGLPKLIKQCLPSTELFLLTSGAGAELVKHDPFIDRIIVFDANWFARAKHRSGGSLASFFALARRLKREKIDTALGLRGDVRENIFMALAGIGRRIGFGITGGGFLLTDPLDDPRKLHASQHASVFLKALGLPSGPPAPALYFEPEERCRFAGRAPALGCSPNQKKVGFQIDAGSFAKEWNEELMVEFIARFRARFPEHRLTLIGTNEIKARRLQSDHTLNWVGKLSLRELCLAMEGFEAFVGADSGPTHIASAMGRPTLFLYSGTNDFEVWKPLAENARTLRHEVVCAPCELTVCPVPGHPCMAGIEPSRAIEELERMLR